MVDSLDKLIKYQKNMITVILFFTIMCWFISFVNLIGIIFIPVYALLYSLKERKLKAELEQFYIDLHEEEFNNYKKSGAKVSLLKIEISPFIKSKHFIKGTFDSHIIEKCNELDKVNLVVTVMILALSGTILFIS